MMEKWRDECSQHFDDINGIMVGIDQRDEAPEPMMLAVGKESVHLSVADALLLMENLAERVRFVRHSYF